jgi:hypothetical protein
LALDAKMIDLGSSEGSFGKAITETSGIQTDITSILTTRWKSTSTLRQYHRVLSLSRATSEEHNPGPIYDVVHEAMLFQFIGPEREQHIAEAKKLLKPSGLFLTDEKVITNNFDENEKTKDEWKAQFYSPEQLQQKQDVVKVQHTGGMIDNMVHQDELAQILQKYFRYIQQYWESGNFVGYAASDDPDVLQRFVSAVSST